MQSTVRPLIFFVTLVILLIATFPFAPTAMAQTPAAGNSPAVKPPMTAVVNSLEDDEDSHPWDNPDTEDIDESLDGVCEDYQHRCTFRAALDEAWYMETSANVTFGPAGTIVQDSNQGTFGIPSGSVIDGGGRRITIRGSGAYPFLMGIDSLTTIKGIVFRAGFDGLDVAGRKNIIGGDLVNEGNTFLGMKQNAIWIFGDSNYVVGNMIGIGADGDAIGIAPGGDTVYNQFGIFVLGSHNIIGDDIGSLRNVISRNQVGISMVGDDSGYIPCTGNEIRGNMFGTATNGQTRKSNGYGVEMLYGSEHIIGSPDVSRFNIISGSREGGILAGIGTNNVTIWYNQFGLSATQTPIPNENGIILGPGSFGCKVLNNDIDWSDAYGVEIAGGHAAFNYYSKDHLLAGNTINDNGLGVAIVDKATGNVMGSSLTADFGPNTIQRNGQGGVFIASQAATPQEARTNTVRKNSFLDNGDLALDIRFSQDNVSPPSIYSYTSSGPTAYVTGKHDEPGSTIDFYRGHKVHDPHWQAYAWLGSTTVQADCTWIGSFDSCACDPLLASATDPDGNTSMFSLLNSGDTPILLDVAFNSGWNMLSVPLTPVNGLADSVFPTAVSNVFAYTASGYGSVGTLGVGPGYWARFGSAGTQSIAGYQVDNDTFDVFAGWNLIGSISGPVPTADVSSIPGGMVASNFFEYNAAYAASDTVRTGKAYWVKVGQAGSLVLSVSGSARPENRIRIVPTEERPPDPPEAQPAVPPLIAARRDVPVPGRAPFIVPNTRNERAHPGTPMEFRYWVPEAGEASLRVLDAATGNVIATLAEGTVGAGYHTARWEMPAATPGRYICELAASGKVAVRSVQVGRPAALRAKR